MRGIPHEPVLAHIVRPQEQSVVAAENGPVVIRTCGDEQAEVEVHDRDGDFHPFIGGEVCKRNRRAAYGMPRNGERPAVHGDGRDGRVGGYGFVVAASEDGVAAGHSQPEVCGAASGDDEVALRAGTTLARASGKKSSGDKACEEKQSFHIFLNLPYGPHAGSRR